MQDATLLLRDIHQPPAPSWWPPAPGWWLVAGLMLIVLVVLLAWRWNHARRRRQITAIFETAVAAADSPAGEVAAMSELLRRAARLINPAADRLQGEAWLAFLDEPDGRARRAGRRNGDANAFSNGPGRLLLDGPFRRDIDTDDVAALRSIARRRFQQWMEGA